MIVKNLIAIFLLGVLMLFACQAVTDFQVDSDKFDLGDPLGDEGSDQQHLLSNTLDELLRFMRIYDDLLSFFAISRHDDLFLSNILITST